jgi:hypothetical protein
VPSTRAVRDGDDWDINGRKIWITRAAEADFTILMAITARGFSADGLETREELAIRGKAQFLGEEFDEALGYAALRKAESVGRPVGSQDWLAEMEARRGKVLAAGKRGLKKEMPKIVPSE